jgi:hypothetical protein
MNRMTHTGWVLLVLAALPLGCAAAERAAAKDPQKCERDPECVQKQGKSRDCITACADNIDCIQRCEQIQKRSGP